MFRRYNIYLQNIKNLSDNPNIVDDTKQTFYISTVIETLAGIAVEAPQTLFKIHYDRMAGKPSHVGYDITGFIQWYKEIMHKHLIKTEKKIKETTGLDFMMLLVNTRDMLSLDTEKEILK